MICLDAVFAIQLAITPLDVDVTFPFNFVVLLFSFTIYAGICRRDHHILLCLKLDQSQFRRSASRSLSRDRRNDVRHGYRSPSITFRSRDSSTDRHRPRDDFADSRDRHFEHCRSPSRPQQRNGSRSRPSHVSFRSSIRDSSTEPLVRTHAGPRSTSSHAVVSCNDSDNEFDDAMNSYQYNISHGGHDGYHKPVLMVVNARVRTANTNSLQNVVLFLDCGVQTSFIATSTVQRIDLKVDDHKPLTTISFGGHSVTESSGTVKVCLVDLLDKPLAILLRTKDALTTPHYQAQLTDEDVCFIKSLGFDPPTQGVSPMLPVTVQDLHSKYCNLLCNAFPALAQIQPSSNITSTDICAAETLLLREHYRESENVLTRLRTDRFNTHTTDCGIIRCPARLDKAIALVRQAPILLVPSHRLTYLIIMHQHKTTDTVPGQRLINSHSSPMDLWHTNYLAALAERDRARIRQGKSTILQGDIVIIVDDTLTRGHWPLGIITSVPSDQLKTHRTAMVRTPNGHILQRSISQLYPLEIQAKEDYWKVEQPPPPPTRVQPPRLAKQRRFYRRWSPP
ncbi:hypothetical protein OESDEN_04509 [Oesophagostomum dentatum]|uniref:DUF5641 domain-containing protein n=1 Tax=Oesophagostomum dentatum TaxID=61180 RepID=A0A0B1THH0_OESDE|nr:hypothetical protein OESDEN_04509 [Oesophagostomum dentatum]